MIFSAFILIALSIGVMAQTASIKGTLAISSNQEVTVEIVKENISVTTNNVFKIENLKAGEYELYITSDHYKDHFVKVVLAENEAKDLGMIFLDPVANDMESDQIPTISSDDLLSEGSGSSVSGLLHGSRDVFLSAAAYTFGPMRFRVRGYDGEYTETSINGAPMGNMENGRTSWSNWGGLNNVTRYKNTTLGLTESEHSFGDVGGTTNIEMRPSQFRAQTNITYSLTNRNYRNRAMFTHSTGLMNNGWALTVSGSRRWAQEGYVEGTWYDTWSYYIGLEKKVNDKLSFVINGFGSAYKRGKQGGSTQEAYDLVDNNYYNPYWGYQTLEDGTVVKRNSRIAQYHKPTAMFTTYYTPSRNTKLTSTFAYRQGRAGGTALNWYNANDPRPDYYRFLPSYMTNAESAKLVAENFSDPKYSQLDWDYMYAANKLSWEAVPEGTDGEVREGYRSQYIQEERRYDQQYFVATTTLNQQIGDHVFLDGGLVFRQFSGSNFKVVTDLLGGDYWVDVDKYAERDIADPDSAQSDLNNPNNIVGVGDRFGYDYNINVLYGKPWVQANFKFNRAEFLLAGFGSYTEFFRDGKMRNGKFPEESYGKSESLDFIDYGGKFGLLIKATGRHYIHGHAAYMTKAPTPRNTYISPRTRDHIIENPVSEIITSADIGYTMRAPKLKATINAFYTKFENQTKIMSFYHDGYRNFVNYAMTGIDKEHQGIEFGMEAKLSSTLTLTGATSLGYYRWSSRPTVDVYVDNSSQELSSDKTVYVQGFLVDGTPQTVATIGLQYRHPKYWFLGTNFNYIDHTYLSFNPERRTEEAVAYINEGTEQWHAIIDQQRLNTEFSERYTVDVFGGKSFKFKDYMLFVNLSVNNLTNNTNIITGGYEQLRFDLEEQNPDKFDPKLYYFYGLSYYLNLSLRF